jgi:hypothetical protein
MAVQGLRRRTNGACATGPAADDAIGPAADDMMGE